MVRDQPAAPSVNVATMAVSIALGLVVFEETIRTAGGGAFWSLLALRVAAADVVMLTVWRTPSSAQPPSVRS